MAIVNIGDRLEIILGKDAVWDNGMLDDVPTTEMPGFRHRRAGEENFRDYGGNKVMGYVLAYMEDRCILTPFKSEGENSDNNSPFQPFYVHTDVTEMSKIKFLDKES
ncbi:hypothetical protein HYW76_03230 [Candidatus Pacearchaeota archaeon]|nr:hypothetical protein [Candidatus Pacearchaeota archaeon]